MKSFILMMFVLETMCVFTDGMPPISPEYNSHCRCVQVESRIIPPHTLSSIKLIPQGPHCPETEVIAGLNSGQKICLNPRSSWVKKLVQFILNKQLNPQGGADKHHP